MQARDHILTAARGYLVCLALCFLLGASTASPKFEMMPGPINQLQSSDGQFQVENHNALVNGIWHRLIVRHNSKSVIYTYPYPRAVDIGWSPGSHRLLVTDFWASNFAKTLVLQFGDSGSNRGDVRTIDVEKALIRNVPAERNLEKYIHRYVEANGWRAEDKIAIVVDAYDGWPYPPINRCYRFILPNQFTLEAVRWCGLRRR
jgi:hypothetical protein